MNLSFTISLTPVTKKNSGRIVMCGRRPMLLPSEAYKRYEKDAGWFLKKYAGMNIDYPVNVKCLFYMPTRRRVDQGNLVNAIDDILVHYNVLEDDNRDIIVGHDGTRVFWDKDNPRCEIEITSVDGYEQWKKK